MESIVKKPSKFLIQGVIYGEEVCVSILPKEKYLVSLNFDSEGREIINIESNCPAAHKSRIYKRIVEFINSIEVEDYYDYSLLLLCDGENMTLANYSLDTLAQNYREVQRLASELKIPSIKYNWKGEYSRKVETSFYEDIIVQIF